MQNQDRKILQKRSRLSFDETDSAQPLKRKKADDLDHITPIPEHIIREYFDFLFPDSKGLLKKSTSILFRTKSLTDYCVDYYNKNPGEKLPHHWLNKYAFIFEYLKFGQEPAAFLRILKLRHGGNILHYFLNDGLQAIDAFQDPDVYDNTCKIPPQALQQKHHFFEAEHDIDESIPSSARDRSKELELLITRFNLNVNEQNLHGSTPLHFAKTAAETSILLKYGANPNIHDFQNKSALELAALVNRDIAQCRALIQSGSSTRETSYGLPIVDLAKDKRTRKHDAFSKELKGMLGFSAPAKEKLQEQFTWLLQYCRKKAQKQGKKPLLVVGEIHHKYWINQAKKMIFASAINEGLKDLYFEFPYDFEVVSLKKLHPFISWTQRPGTSPTTCHFVDNGRFNQTLANISSVGVVYRNHVMAKEVNNIAKAGLLHVGQAHLLSLLDGFLSTRLNPSIFYLVPIDLTPLSTPRSFLVECAANLFRPENFLFSDTNPDKAIMVSENGFDTKKAKEILRKRNG